MVSQKITVKNMTGFHLRPAGILCKIAMNYKSKVQFQFNSVTANAKSVLSVLGAGVKNGDEIEVDIANGIIKNVTQNKEYKTNSYPEKIQNLIRKGGLINYTKEKLNV